jgi:hypothetical protein
MDGVLDSFGILLGDFLNKYTAPDSSGGIGHDGTS